MGEERRSSPSVCLHDFFAQKFDGVLFNARYIGARLLKTMPERQNCLTVPAFLMDKHCRLTIGGHSASFHQSAEACFGKDGS